MLAAKLSYRYTKKELNKLLNSMVILIDTREKKQSMLLSRMYKTETLGNMKEYRKLRSQLLKDYADHYRFNSR